MTRLFPLNARNHSVGFTLIELSIVLIIIALIVGGVVVGRSLIRQSELRSILTDVETFKTAMNLFRLQYGGMPGDLKNATSFWGQNPNCDTNGVGTGTETCNGNGDGWVDLNTDDTRSMEQFTVWQHLSNAGLIERKYTGRSSRYPYCVPWKNCPGGRVNSLQAYYFAARSQSSTASWWPYSKSHFFIAGRNDRHNADTGYPGRGILTPQEAYAIDDKADDGRPSLGRWQEFSAASYTRGCSIDGRDGSVITHGGNQQNFAVYNVANPDIACSFRVFVK